MLPLKPPKDPPGPWLEPPPFIFANGLLTLGPVSNEEEKLKPEPPPPAPNDTGWVPFEAGLELAPGKLCDWPNVKPFEMLGG